MLPVDLFNPAMSTTVHFTFSAPASTGEERMDAKLVATLSTTSLKGRAS